MGNGYTTKIRVQWMSDAELVTHNAVVTVPTTLGMIVIASLALSIIEIFRKVK